MGGEAPHRGDEGKPLVVVRLSRRRLWRWQAWLVRALAEHGRVAVAFVDGPPLPPAVALLLRLESTVFRLSGEQAADLLDPSAADAPAPPAGSRAALTIDLAGLPGGAWPDAPVLRPLYGGHADDAALLAALLARTEVRLSFEGFGEDHRPAVEDPDVLKRALNTVFGTLLRLCLRQVGPAGRLSHAEAARPAAPAARPSVAAFVLRSLRSKAEGRLDDLCRRAPRWRVGWRATGLPDSVGLTHRLPGSGYRVLPDDGRRYYADPFLLAHEGRRLLFVEEYPLATGKGLISVADISGDGSVGVPRPVLELGVHASYPFVFRHAGAAWMIPETSSSGRVDLYRAVRVPDRWERVATLLDGVDAADVTLTRQGGLWWMFAATRAWGSSCRDALSLFSARDLTGPWTPHPANPVLVDRRGARPGGAMFRVGDALWRPAQDATYGYGSGLSLCRIEGLTPERFAQTAVSILRFGPPGRGAGGIHTMNFDGAIEVVDGLVRGGAERPFMAPDRAHAGLRVASVP